MINLFQNILFTKNFLHAMAVLVYLQKIKRSLGPPFVLHFPVWFFHKNVPYLRFHHRTKFQCHTFYPSQDIKQNALLWSYLHSWCHKLLRFILDQSLKQCLTGRKREEDRNTKIWIPQEWKELFRWNKKHFSYFLKGYHLVKNKNLIKNSRHKL